MMRFNDLKPGQQIVIDGKTLDIMPHPIAPTMAYGQEGRKAVVYQLGNSNRLFALKVFKPKYRQPGLVDICQSQREITMPGMEVCDRRCLAGVDDQSLVKQFPELEYAILMPWIEGTTWFDIVASKTIISLNDSKLLANSTAKLLCGLEQKGLAHCDVTGANVIVNLQTGQVSLVDVEDMFGTGLPQPDNLPQGSSGYQHQAIQNQTKGQWQAVGDRFAAAILLAEILSWHHPDIRQAAVEEHFFDNNELQDPLSPRFKLILDVLNDLSTEVAQCFHRAWHSASLTECPSLNEWYERLTELSVKEWQPIEAPPVRLSKNSNLVQTPSDDRDYLSAEANAGLDERPVSSLIGQRPEMLLAPPYIYNMKSVGINEAVTIRWSAVENARYYELQEANNDVEIQEDLFVTIFEGAHTSFQREVNEFGTLYYRVRAMGFNQESDWSSILPVDINPLTKPETPFLQPINNPMGDATYLVSWTAVANADWYELEEANGIYLWSRYRKIWFNDSPRIKRTQLVLCGNNPGIYRYRVRAHNRCGYSPYSLPVTIKIKKQLISTAPGMMAIQNPNQEGDFFVRWEHLKDASGYILYEARSSEFDQAQRVYEGQNNEVQMRDKKPGTYFYQVFAYNSQRFFDYANPSNRQGTQVLMKTPIWHEPSEQKNQRKNNLLSIRLSWESTQWATSYELAWQDISGNQHIDAIKSNTCTIQRPKGNFQFQVRAISEQGVASNWSKPLNVELHDQGNNSLVLMLENDEKAENDTV